MNSLGFSFLVFAENKGNGSFEIHENSYKGHWTFGRCLDYDNDGRMELLAGIQNEDDGTAYHPYNVAYKALYLFRLDRMTGIGEPQEALVKSWFTRTESNSTSADMNTVGIVMADFDNDGRMELMADTVCHPEYRTNVGYWTYRDLPLLQGIPANEAPQRMSAPSVNLDRKSGKLKIAWKPGEDKETSTVDLTYALRIGSAPVRTTSISRGRMPMAADAISAPATWGQIWMPRWM